MNLDQAPQDLGAFVFPLVGGLHRDADDEPVFQIPGY